MKRFISENGAGFVTITLVLFACASPFIFTQYGAERFNYSDTGQIGDTIGGLTAPIIGVLNAILLYWTIRTQSQQIRQDRLRFDIDKRIDRVKASIKGLKIVIDEIIVVPDNEIKGKHKGMNSLVTLWA